jgi:hypothetical protein
MGSDVALVGAAFACYTSPARCRAAASSAMMNKEFHVAPGRRLVRPVRRTTTFGSSGVSAPTEGQSTQVPGHPVEGFFISRGPDGESRVQSRGEY